MKDLERQMIVLNKSHVNRRQHQSNLFRKEIEYLENERNQKHVDLTTKMDNEKEEFNKSSKQRLNKLSEMQRILIESFDKDWAEKLGVQIQQQNHR